jgi:hypothetical protein
MGRWTIVRCEISGCGEHATHKVASRWSNSQFSELKTYGFACPEHVDEVCRRAAIRWLDYEPVKGESLGEIGIYHFEEGKGDRNLQHDRAMEAAFLA